MSVLQYDTLGLKSKPEDFHSPGVYKTLRIHNIENRDGQNNISLKILISLRAKWDFEMRFSFQNLTSEVRKKNLTSNSHFVEVRLEFFQKISLRWSEMRISKKNLTSKNWDENFWEKSHFVFSRWDFFLEFSFRFWKWWQNWPNQIAGSKISALKSHIKNPGQTAYMI